MPPQIPACAHGHAQLDVSPHAEEAGFKRPPLHKRRAAATPSGSAPRTGDETQHLHIESLFPGPLVLPDDALALDPSEPPQSMKAWMQDELRNPVTRQRKTIYIGPAPDVSEQLSSLSSWAVPSASQQHQTCKPPQTDHVRKYLEAFYHPLPVRVLPQPVRFVPWDTGRGASRLPKHIGLQIGDSVTRIRTRPAPDKAFARQLDLNDILDAAIEALPDDAYALVMLLHHDLYEDADDDFCCGRAYGNSRVAVVSSARYHPGLDRAAGIDREHMWPASHCAAYVREMCNPPSARGSKRRRVTRADMSLAGPGTPMAAVIRSALPALNEADMDLDGLWLSRVARTVSHELGHCFCLDHCAYYACVMQGTAGIAEDVRQPPYLCFVCLSKLTWAVREVGEGVDEVELQIGRYTALASFCGEHLGVGMFAAYRGWLHKRIEMLKRGDDATPGEGFGDGNLAR